METALFVLNLVFKERLGTGVIRVLHFKFYTIINAVEYIVYFNSYLVRTIPSVYCPPALSNLKIYVCDPINRYQTSSHSTKNHNGNISDKTP